jgi:hypothetical protein
MNLHKEQKMRKTTATTFAILSALAAAPQMAQAQQPAATGATMVASEPGKAAIMSTVEATAKVVAIDKATRTVTLKDPSARSTSSPAMKSETSTRSGSATS